MGFRLPVTYLTTSSVSLQILLCCCVLLGSPLVGDQWSVSWMYGILVVILNTTFRGWSATLSVGGQGSNLQVALGFGTTS